MDEKKLGEKLQLARQAAGLTQQGLCQKAGLSYSTLAKIERGAIKTPSIFTIQRIATALGTTLDTLVGSGRPTVPKREHSRSGISFVYFDINGCLVRFYHQAFTKIGIDSDLPSDVVETAFWHYNDQVCRGNMTMTAFNVALGRRLKLPSFDWTTYYMEATKSTPKVAELVTWAKNHYGVGLLTNIMPGLLNRMRHDGLIPDIAYDAVIDSSEVHMLKPERAIYELATKKAATPSASEILFIDDSRTNLMAAERLGWHVLWFDESNPESSIARIRDALQLSKA